MWCYLITHSVEEPNHGNVSKAVLSSANDCINVVESFINLRLDQQASALNSKLDKLKIVLEGRQALAKKADPVKKK